MKKEDSASLNLEAIENFKRVLAQRPQGKFPIIIPLYMQTEENRYLLQKVLDFYKNNPYVEIIYQKYL